jgi:tripartite-type tricarboxylate transporter receptor subunit TctC
MPILLQPTRRGFLCQSAAACMAPRLSHSAGAAPLRVIVPFAPGGPSDVVLRALTAYWAGRNAQPVIVEHKPGAAGSIGAALARRAEPDGQTLLFAPADVLVNNTATFRDLPYDPLRDFKPLALIGPVPLVLVTPGSIAVRTLADFHAWAKTRRIGYGSWGEGSHAHLLADSLLVRHLHLDAVHVPYRGLAPMLQDLIGGQLNAAFAVPPAAGPHVVSGRLQALAVSGERRSVALPGTPILSELGFEQPVFRLRQWAAFLAPAATAPATLERLEHELTVALDDASVRQALQTVGFEIERPLGAADASATLRADLALIPPLIRAMGITPQ